MDIMTALQKVTYGLYIVGAADGERNGGCIINTVIQVTAENPMICISMNKENTTFELIEKEKKFSISVLSEQSNPKLIGTFGFQNSKEIDKYQGVEFERKAGVPVVLEHTCAYLVCETVSFTDAETHCLILARVLEGDIVKKESPMTYEYYHRVVKGKAPKKAPTYVEERAKDKGISYICDICGYVYEGDISLEPDNYVCPICGVDKTHFVKQ